MTTEFSPQKTNKLTYIVDFFYGQYFKVKANSMNEFESVSLYDINDQLINEFDVDYIEELVHPNIISKFWSKYYSL